MGKPLIRIGFCYGIALSAVIFTWTSLFTRSQCAVPYGPGYINNTTSSNASINMTIPIVPLHLQGPLANFLSNGLAIRPDGTIGIDTINVGSNKLAVESTIGARRTNALYLRKPNWRRAERDRSVKDAAEGN